MLCFFEGAAYVPGNEGFFLVQWNGRPLFQTASRCQNRGDIPLTERSVHHRDDYRDIDLAKNIFQAHGVDAQGKAVLRKKLDRSKMTGYFINLPPCLIGMEASGGAHYWARKPSAMGHTVKLMVPQFVKPYVKINKNDAADAKAICEAVPRPNMLRAKAEVKCIATSSLDALQTLKILLFAIGRAGRLMMTSPPPACKIPDLSEHTKQMTG